MVMSDRIKANRQALEYYKVAQELLEMATNDASDFIDDYEDRDITPQDFKRETSGWVSHLDDIIDDLKGKPDPLNLLPKATALRKQLGQVSSRPADDLSYDMQHAAGSPAQSRERFWNKISNMFESVVSAEPAIIRAPRDGALDVFEQPKPGYANQVQANTRRDKPQVSNIPDKPKQALPRRGKPDVNEFVKPSYAPKVETPVETRQEVKPVVHQHQVEVPKQTIQETRLQQKQDLKHQIEKEQELDLLHNQKLDASQPIDIDEILSEASKQALKISNTQDVSISNAKKILSGVSVDASNILENLNSLAGVLDIFDKLDLRNASSLHHDLVTSLADFNQHFTGHDIFGRAQTPEFMKEFGGKSINGISLKSILHNINVAYADIQKISKNKDAQSSKRRYADQDISRLKSLASKLNAAVEILVANLDLLESETVLINTLAPEVSISNQFAFIAEQLRDKDSKWSQIYIKDDYYPDNINDKEDLIDSINELRILIAEEKGQSSIDDQVRPFDPNYYKSYKANQSKQLSALINMIENKIESPFDNDDLEDMANDAPLLYSELDKQSRGLEKDPSTSGAAVSVNKLKNKLLKVIRNTALAMEPEFKGEMVSASQNAVLQRDPRRVL
jgi:hypothetical protein